MTEEITKILKDTYPRDIRKQVVKSIINDEKNHKTTNNYKIINQIFSYVLKEANWSMSKDSTSLDTKPLEIMLEVFPKIDTTKWYQEQTIVVNNSIKLIQN